MGNFIIAFRKKIQLPILFVLFIGMISSYGQDKKINDSRTNAKQSSVEGFIDIRNKNFHVISSDKTIVTSNKKSLKAAKAAADTEAPVIICPPNQQLACGSLVPDYFGLLAVTDNIDTAIDVTQNPGQGSDFYDGMTIKFTATDDAGNTSECTITVTASSPDVTPPTFTCPTGLTFNCGDVMPNYALDPMMNLDDDCSINLSYVMTPGPGSDFYDGVPVQIEYFDKSGNRSVCNFTVKMATPDITKPVITDCPGTQSLACGSVLPDYRPLIKATDNCLENMTVSQSPAPGSTFVPGMTVTMTVKDAANNATTCSFVVNASADITKPTITCPGNQTVALGDLLPNYSGMVAVSDNCDTNPTITQTPAAGSAFAAGMTVTMRATDTSGNFQTCSFIVNALSGDLPPTIVCPSGQELYPDSTLPDYVSFLPDVKDDITDNMDLIFTQNPPQGTLFTADTNVTITVKDESGNTNSCSFLVKLKTTTASIDCKTASFNVSNLNGVNGFTIYGEKLTRETGFSVNNAGDINGDGISDLIIGAPGNYDPWYGVKKKYKIIKGAAYVVFGKSSGFSPNIDLGLLDGSNGFAVRNDNTSTNFPMTGYDVCSTGDINGDGIGDFMISDPYRHTSYGPEVGHTYVVFGRKSGFPAEFNLSTLNGTNGFTLIGASSGESSGKSIATVGDINGDGYMDIAVITSGSGAINGKCYVIYGKTGGFPTVLRTNELNGTNGFIIEGDATMGKVGESVAGLGDINGDGISDIAMGTYNETGQNRKYVVFGRSSNFPAIFNISSLNGSNGFVVENSANPLNSYSGVAKAGDINNDGINDIAITGQYILFGKTVFPAVFDLKNLDGTNGFTIKNASIGEKFGYAGDFNADGIDDYFFQYYGSVTILFGQKIWTTNADMFTQKKLTISTSFTSGYSASFAGDINNDGISDIIIGTSFDSYGDNLKVNYNPGKAYVIYGKKTADTEKPVITNCPADKTVTIHDPIPDYTKDITVTDNCDTKPIVAQSPVAGTVFDGVTQEVTLTVTDASGNIATCSFNINSSGADLPPTIECPSDQELYANSMLPNYVHFLTDVSDDIAEPWELIFTQTPVAGTLFTADTNVTITVEDKSGNKKSCSFLVKLKSGGFDIDCKTATINTNELNGKNGFSIYGEKAGSKSGDNNTPIGDVNGDGIADFLIGAPGYLGLSVGAYVVFGMTAGFPPSINLADLDGTNGFKIIDDDMTYPRKIGTDVSATGDINGDGIDDLVLSDPYKSNSGTYYAGRVFVIYGRKTGFTETFSLSTLDGSNGFKILGKTYDEFFGIAIADIGDFNNDLHNDIAIVSANEGSGNIKKCYILFGRSTNFPSVIDVESLDHSTSFIIEGDIGQRLSGLGDTNGDGIPDIVFTGEYNKYRYVIYGSNNLPAKLHTSSLDGTNGFRIENSAKPLNTSEYFEVRGLGDINGDTFTDIGIDSYVLFGKSSNSAVVDLKDLNGTNGFVIDNFNFEYLHSYNSNGDFNNDGFDDLLLPFHNDIYIIYGKASWLSSININALSAFDALKIKVRYASKYSLSFIGDVNSDSVDDIIIGATKNTYTSDPNEDPGISYVIFGKQITLDTEKPVITNCPANQVLAINDPIPDYKSAITVTDNCDDTPIITQSPVSGTVFDGVSQEVTLTVNDASGNFETCKFTIATTSTTDTQAPIVTCPANQQLTCGTATIPDYTASVTVSDDVDPSPTVTQSPVAGSPFADGMTVTITAKDASGNESTCSFKINASADVTKPVITCIGNQTLSFGDVLPDYSALITATDNCDTAPIVTQTPAAGSPFVDGMTVEISAKDASGNTETCSFLINESVDTEKPVITCLTDQSVDCSTNVVADYTNLVTATDNNDSNPVITQSPAAGSPFTDGMTITFTAKDASGNESDCSFKISASADVTKPVITCIGNQTLASGDVLPDYSALITATDNCDAAPIVTQNPVAGSAFTDGMTVVISATDASGNTETCSFVITAKAETDTQAPVITCLTNQQVSCSTAKVPDYTSVISVTDNKDPNPTVKQSPAPGSVFKDGMTVTITATDASSNESTCSFKINSDILLVDAGDDIEIKQGELVQLEAVATEEGSFKWTPTKGVSNAFISNPFFSPVETTTYTVSFTNKEGCEVHDSVIISVEPKEKDETKYGFSPNNDGINDFWMIHDITNYPDNEVSIYSSWGDLVFQTKGYNNSTNVFSGIANRKRNLGADRLPEGTYFFEINPNAASHHFKKLKGYLVLKR